MTGDAADSAFAMAATYLTKAWEQGLDAVEYLLGRLGFDGAVKAVQRLTGRRQERYGDLIGLTPLVDITELMNPKVEGVRVVAKCEFLNPAFSIKDRIVENIFDKAESAGLLEKGDTVIAASSGNTGASVAMLGAVRGYKVVITTSPKCSQEKRAAIEAYGAKLLVSPPDLKEDDQLHYMNMAKTRARDNGWFDVNQYDNPDNTAAHYETMGPEIWKQTCGRVTHFVAGGSTGGTISGTGRYLKEQNPKIKVTLADPVGSVFGEYHATKKVGTAGKWKVEGVGKGSIPLCMDVRVINDVIKVTDEEAFSRCHQLARTEGLMVGGSAGLNVEAALRVASTAKAPAVIVTVLCDLGVKYLSKVFNEDWLAQNNITIR